MNKIKIVCEIGWNHLGDMALAKHMIKSAKDSGANFAKFQTWSVVRLTNGPWDSDGRRQIYEKAELSEDNHIELSNYCQEIGINFLTSVFSLPDVNMLLKLKRNNLIKLDSIKIPSFECRNFELIRKCVDNFYKVCVSFGTSTIDEIELFVKEFKMDLHSIIPMHCVSSYPLLPKYANIKRMQLIKDIFDNCYNFNIVGYSDHMEGVESAKVAIEMGATIIEKHFTIDKTLPGRDNQFACLPEDIKNLSNYIKMREEMLNNFSVNYLDCETDARNLYTGRFDKK